MMSQAKVLMDHYKEVRDRLRGPPNAVPDPGIDLLAKKPKVQHQFLERVIESLTPPLPTVIDYSLAMPFKRTDLTFSSTLEYAAKEFGISLKDIKARSRIPTYSLPRQIAIFLADKHKVQTLSGMGKYLGMDHTTMIHARKRIIGLMGTDATLSQRITNLETKILAAFHRTPVPALGQPHLGSEAEQQNRDAGPDAVTEISGMDQGSRSTLCDAETKVVEPDVVWGLPLPTRTGET